MKITRENHDELNATICLELQTDDYKSDFDKELQGYSKKVQMKGFRKGKVPRSIVKKMYGRPVFADVVIKKVNQSLSQYLQDEGLRLLGQPIPSLSQKQYDFDPDEINDFTFLFDIGIEPEIELQGAGESESYIYKKVDIQEDTIDEEMKNAQIRSGKEVEAEDKVLENDRILLQAAELEDGKVKEGGWETGFQVLVKMIGDDEVKKDVLNKSKGDSVTFNIRTIESNSNEKHIRKHLLQMDDDDETVIGDMFEGKIEKIIRIAPADLNEEFFTQYFGEETKTEEEARKILKSNMEKFFEGQSDALLYKTIQDRLMEINSFQMPEEFLKRWMKSGDNKVSEEEIDKGFEDFMKGLKWSLIRNKLSQDHQLDVAEADLKAYFRTRMLQYMGGYVADEAMIDYSVQKLMENSEQVNRAYEDIMTDKVFKKVKESVTLEEDLIDQKELETLLQEAKGDQKAS